MPYKQNQKSNLSSNLEKLEEISQWFENQEQVDVEKGLDKVKEAVNLIKESKEKLHKVENEFEELKQELKQEDNNN